MAAGVAVSVLLTRLRESLADGTIPYPRVTEQVEILESNLEATLWFMEDADRKQDNDERIRMFLGRLEDICYRVEDVLDNYTLKVVSRRREGRFKDVLKRYLCIFCELVGQKQWALEIVTLNKMINVRLDRLQSYGLQRTPEGESSRGAHRSLERSITSSVLRVEDIVGLDNEIHEVLSLLFGKGRQLPVIPICGMGGSGKTTLARLIYNHVQVRRYFDRFAWVTIDQKYRTKSVLRDTLVQLIPELREEIMHFEDIKLAKKLLEVLQSKKCLVILDDVWSTEVWESLRVAFTYFRETDSKVLVTTRNRNLAQDMAGTDYVHVMTPLRTEESLVLFKRIAFPRSESDIEDVREMEKMGRDIVTKFGGLPLAVVALGKLLASKSLSEWKIVHAGINSFLKTDQGSGELSVIMEVLSMSYNDLPHSLKPYFLYLGHFPEDSVIEMEKLYLLWMAEGIIPLRFEHKTLMETGSSYLDELAARSMVSLQDDEVPTIRRFKSCRLHDLMREFCLAKLRKDNFFEVMDLRNSNVLNHYPYSTNFDQAHETRRLAVYLDKYEYENPAEKISRVMEKADHLRSLLFLNAYHHEDEEYLVWPEEVFNLKEFRFLRALEFDGYSFQTSRLPKGIAKLVHLGYLSLRGCYLKELPSGIGNLLNLQTLDLRVTSSCKMTTPNILWKPKSLRHLYLSVVFQAKGVNKLHFAGLTKLEILENFDTSVCHAQHLIELTNLRILDATTSGTNEDLKAIIAVMVTISVRQLTLEVKNFDCYSIERRSIVTDLLICRVLHTLHIDGHIGELPEINSSSLTNLSFSGSELGEDPMATLEKLPNLWVLVLGDAAYVGKDMVCSYSGFPQLRQLQLSGLNKLQRLTIKKGAMTKLTTLTIERCKRLEVPLDGLSSLSSLKKLKIASMPMEFEDGLRKVEETLLKEQGLTIKFLDDSHKEKIATWRH